MPNRILEMDILRGFAVLGILLHNINEFGLPSNINSYPGLFTNGYAANTYAWVFNTLFVSDAIRGIFSILFGASAMILLNDEKLAQQGVRAVDHFYRRNLLLIAFGMLHAYVLLWPYDVLYVYGLMGLFLFPLRKLPVMVLLCIGLLMQVFLDVSLEFGGKDEILNDQSLFETSSEQYTEDQMRAELMDGINDEVLFYNKNYLTIFLVQIPIVVTEQSLNLFRNNLLDMGGMMLIGMALFRYGVLSGLRSIRFYIILASICYLIGLGSRSLFAYSLLEGQRAGIGVWLFDGNEYSFSRVFVAVGHVCVLMLMMKTNAFMKLFSSLAIVGRMALTNYLLQTVIAILLFYGFGLGLYATLERYELIYVCMVIWLILIMFSLIWLHYFYQGPLEWLMRMVIYWRLQPLRRVQQVNDTRPKSSVIIEASPR